jgi:hypothetical protein
MIKNIDDIISQGISQIEWILKEFGKKAAGDKGTADCVKNSC